MMRVFPTQLKVVNNQRDLKPDEEGVKGYYNAKSKGCLQIGVSNNKIYLNSPHNWYRSYTLVLNPTTLPTPASISVFNQGVAPDAAAAASKSDDEEEGEVVVAEPGSTVGSVWRIVASVLKTHCGRKVVYVPGEHYVTVPFVGKSEVKRIYYQFQHVLSSLKVEYSLSNSWFSPSFSSALVPDVRTKPKRRRKKHNLEALEAMHRNKWIHV